MTNKIDMRNKYHTRSGQKVRVLTVSRKDPVHPVIALIDESWVREYDEYGNFVKGQAHELDLIKETIKTSTDVKYMTPFGIKELRLHFVDTELVRVEIRKDEKTDGL